MTGNLTSARPGPLARPTLLPGLRRIWRDRNRLQLGVDPARAVVLELPHAGTARLLDLLDGTRSERAVISDAGRYGIGEPDAQAVLATLRAAGLVVGAQSLLPQNLPDPIRRRLADEAAALALRAPVAPGGSANPGTPAQILRRRAAARVVVTGSGPLAAPVALALALAGVGHVWPDLDRAAPTSGPAPGSRADHLVNGPATGRAGELAGELATGLAELRPGQRLAQVIARSAPGTRTWPLRRGQASFVVQAGATGPANLAAAGYARRRLAHLAVAVRDGTPVIGPLVPPAGAPCLNCLDLHRRDRDPGWPELAAQLALPAREPCGAATVLHAAGLAAGEVLAWLDGDTPATLGTSVEITRGGQLRRRTWPPHPRCGCLRRRPRRGTR
jgi:bacteriocin biosynthesis cyclodehydratase domain-containing protein